ncbi:MAG TPA: glycosyltransferase 87 family protein [Candidatus Limnocylindria bacterium]|nr:glycosyltransferase 87 family protein [Candidatus Limnocylindria bacterium]
MRSTAAVALVAACAVILGLVVRLLVASSAPAPWRAYGYTDLVRVFFLGPVLELHWPYVLFPFEYHPLLGWTSGLLSLVTTAIGPLVVAWGVVVAFAAAAAAVLMTRLAPAGRVAAFWSLSPQLWLLGSLNFDAIPVACLVGAAVAARSGRDALAGAALGLGAAAKLFPLVALPPLAIALARDRRARAAAAVAGALVVLAAIDGPAVLAPYSLLRFGHSPFLLPAPNVDSVFMPLAFALGTVLDPGAADLAVRAVSAAGLVLTYAWLCLRPALRGGDPVRLFWVGVVVVLLWSRLYSPQYSLWVLPAFALFVPDRRIFALLAAGDVATWLGIFGLFGGADLLLVPVLLAGIFARHAALILLLVALVRRAPIRGSGA